MSSKFAVGDKVRCLKDEFGEKEFLIGQVGVIVNRDQSVGDQDWLVRFDDSDAPTNGYDDGWWMTPTEIELIEGGDSTNG